MHTDTTDLQGVQVNVIQASTGVRIQVTCDFILGSDAQGCMVVLVGQSENTTINITMDDECTVKILPHATTLSDIFGFDIEYDGSVGTLAIPGTITATADIPPCLSLNNTTTQEPPAAGPGEYRGIGLHCINDYHLACICRYAMDYSGNFSCCHCFIDCDYCYYCIYYCLLLHQKVLVSHETIPNECYSPHNMNFLRFHTQNKELADREDKAQEVMSYYEKPKFLFSKRKVIFMISALVVHIEALSNIE